jgi:hypothetical protein
MAGKYTIPGRDYIMRGFPISDTQIALHPSTLMNLFSQFTSYMNRLMIIGVHWCPLTLSSRPAPVQDPTRTK